MVYQAAVRGINLRKGPWLEEEDERLTNIVSLLGEGKWDSIARVSGLNRSGKSCRLRWLNYLRPNLKRGHISSEEEQIIIQLHELWGNKWSKIARTLPGRTDNEIKNYWRTHLRKKMRSQDGGMQISSDFWRNFERKTNGSQQDFLFTEGDTSARNYNMKDYRSLEDNMRTTDSSLEHDGLSTFAYLNSPYEPKLRDWMPELSGRQSELKIHEDCPGSYSCFCCETWNEDSYSSTLECCGSLWDMS